MLDIVGTYKYLVLIIDNKIYGQVNHEIRRLKEIPNNIHINTAVTIDKSVIEHSLDYSGIV